MPFFSSAMPFFPAPCPFSEPTLCALQFGKKIVKIGQKIEKLQDFLLEVCRNKFGKFIIMTSTVLIALIPCLLSLNCGGKLLNDKYPT